MSVHIKLHERGDTIIEVLIVLAVLGMAISISYATANRSLLNARQAQESSTASELARRQIERIRTLSGITDSTDPNYIYVTNRSFCINDANNVVPIIGSPFPPACQFSVGGSYSYDIQSDYLGSANDNFRVTVTWDDVMGQGRDRATLEYRVHK